MKKGKKIIKFIAGLVAVMIILALFLAVDAFIGNPISARIATYKINNYVEENYPNMYLNVSKASYNFKTSRYQSLVKSNTSLDTVFSVSWKNGNISDNYEFEVGNRFSTYRRLSEEFDKIVENIIKEEFPYEINLIIGDFSKSDGDFSSLDLDMPLDIYNLPLDPYLTIWIVSEDISYETIEKVLIDIHSLMLKHNIIIKEYSIRLEKPNREEEKMKQIQYDGYLNNFPAELISEYNLLQLIKEHQIKQEQSYKK